MARQRFKGWSGPTRMISGTLAFGMALLLQAEWVPRTAAAHVMAWGVVFLAASMLSLGALVHWFMKDKVIQRDWRRLGPLLDVVPPLAVGALFTGVLLLSREVDQLFGVWMCMFGLANIASRYVLPAMISLVGVFYIAGGALYLLTPGLGFLDAWVMGLVFGVGEWAGGLILYVDERRYAAFERISPIPPEHAP